MNLQAQREVVTEGLDNLRDIFEESLQENEILRKTNKNLKEQVLKLTPLVEENARLKERIVVVESHVQVGQDKPKMTIEPETVFYSTGDKFVSESEAEEEEGIFVLAQTEAGEVNLISLKDGNRWSQHMTVTDTKKISKTDFHKHFDSSDTKWVLQS